MKFLQKIRLALIYGMLVLPALYTPFTYFPSNYGKAVLFAIGIEVLCLAAVFAWWQGRTPLPALKSIWNSLSVLDISVLFFLTALLISSLLGVNVAQSFWGTQARAGGWFMWLHFVVWYFVIKSGLGSSIKIKTALTISAVVGMLVVLTALVPSSMPTSWFAATSTRLSGIFGNPAFLANYLTFAIGVALLLVFSARKKTTSFFWLLTALLFSVTQFLTNTRGAFLGLMVGLVVGAIAFIFFTNDTKIKRTFTRTASVAALLFVASLCVFAFSPAMQKSFPRAATLLNLKTYTSATAQTRMLAWGEAVRGFTSRPVLGWGMENFDTVHNAFYAPKLMRYSFAETVWDKPHNWLLEIAVVGGVVGVLGYLAVNLAALYSVAKPQSTSANTELSSPAARAVLFAVIVAAGVQNLFLFETTATTILWFFMLGLIARLYGSKTTASLNVLHVPNALKTPLALGGVVCILASLYCFQVVPLTMSYHLSLAANAADSETWATEAEKTLVINSPVTVESAVFLADRFVQLDKSGIDITAPATVAAAKKTAYTLEKDFMKHPQSPTAPVWAGQIYMVLGEKVTSTYYASAEENLLAAVKLSPQKQDILFLLGRLYLLEKKLALALEVQQKAIAGEPSIGIGHWFYGLTQIADGKIEEGLASIERAESLKFRLTKDQELYVIDNYAIIKRYDKIIPRYLKMLEKDPENLSLLQNLAATYAVAGQKKEALEIVQKVVSMFPPLKAAADQFIKEYKLDSK